MLAHPPSPLLVHHLLCDLLICTCSCPFVYTKASVPAQISPSHLHPSQEDDMPSRDLTALLLTVAPNEDLLCAQHVLQG